MSLAEKHWSLDLHGTNHDKLMLKHIAMVIYAKEIWQSRDSSSFTYNSFQYQKAPFLRNSRIAQVKKIIRFPIVLCDKGQSAQDEL